MSTSFCATLDIQYVMSTHVASKLDYKLAFSLHDCVSLLVLWKSAN